MDYIIEHLNGKAGYRVRWELSTKGFGWLNMRCFATEEEACKFALSL